MLKIFLFTKVGIFFVVRSLHIFTTFTYKIITMKKLFVILLLQSLFFAGIQAHKPPMKWGKVTNDELRMDSYSYDPQAPAVILCDYGTTEVGARTEYTRHIRIKILKPGGLRYATIEVPYKSYSRFEVLTNIQAQTFNLSDKGTIIKTKVPAKDFKDEIIDNRNKKRVFTFRDVKPGSVIEYRYTIRSLDLVCLENWYFQSTIPTILSEYWVSMPLRFNYLITFQKGRELDMDEQKSFGDRIQWLYNTTVKKAQKELYKDKYLLFASPKGTAKVYLSNGETMFFKMKDIPALKPTPDMLTFSDYYPTVKAHLYYVDRSFGLPFYYRTILDAAQTDYGSWTPNRLYYNRFNGYILYWLPTWEEFNQTWLKDERIGGRFIKSFDYKPIVDTTTTMDDNGLKKAETIFGYVKSNIRWNGIYSMYATNNLNKILDKKTGNSGEVNILLISLLKKAGIETDPVLVRTRNLGRIENMYPVSEQFNHIIAQVTVDGKKYYMDACAPSDTFRKLPWTVNNAYGWILKKDNYGWTEINNPI
jgi:hypothetical protein